MVVAENLDELFTLMKSDAAGEDWSKLPTFGAPWSGDTAEIWSWDETRVIWGTNPNDISIETRAHVSKTMAGGTWCWRCLPDGNSIRWLRL